VGEERVERGPGDGAHQCRQCSPDEWGCSDPSKRRIVEGVDRAVISSRLQAAECSPRVLLVEIRSVGGLQRGTVRIDTGFAEEFRRREQAFVAGMPGRTGEGGGHGGVEVVRTRFDRAMLCARVLVSFAMAPISFSDDEGFDFAVRCILSGVAYGMAEIGEVLSVAEQVEASNVDAWFDGWTGLGARVDAIAERAERAGHAQSAAQAYLRAANYRFAGFYYVLGTAHAAEHLAAWNAHRRSLERSLLCRAPAVERLPVTFDGVELRAWRFRGSGRPGRHPTLLIHNGLGSPLSDVFMTGAADAMLRGWDAIVFDGPGQGHARFVDGLGPVDDWGPVGIAVLDAALALGDVDPERVVASGIADGGFLAAVHGAADPRIAALVCDPGVIRPIDGAIGGLPEDLATAWRAGESVDAMAERDRETKFALEKLVEQWPGSSADDVLARLASWDLEPLLDRIRVPTFVADPDAAAAFAGQSAELVGLLGERATLVPFTTTEGAGLDCEIGAPQLRNQRVFDWLDETLG
jgi:hypothetical protein